MAYVLDRNSIAWQLEATLRPLLLALILLATGAGLTWWGLGPRVGLQAARADRAEQRLAESRQLIDLQAGAGEQ